MKRSLRLIAILLVLACLCGCSRLKFGEKEKPSETVLPPMEEPYVHDTTPALTEVTQSFPLFFGDEPMNDPILCVGNRPYISSDALAALPVVQHSGRNDLYFPTLEQDGRQYIALADAAWQYDLSPVFESEEVHLYIRQPAAWDDRPAATGDKPALIRLEDIMADRGAAYRFSHEQLLKTRILVDYLSNAVDHFYIAWIPLYLYPEYNVNNDISLHYDFYNTDFVYTLDLMQRCGGLVGLHGYTHQYQDSRSAEGYEFGDEMGYTEEEIVGRFQAAEEICHRMGYTYHFFEFSHFRANELEKEVAERFFDAVYQHRNTAEQGQVMTVTNGDHTCIWVPNHAGYVDGLKDKDSMIQRLTNDEQSGKLISLFFHPPVDFECISSTIDGTTISYDYDEETAALPAILNLVQGWGHNFGAFPAN